MRHIFPLGRRPLAYWAGKPGSSTRSRQIANRLGTRRTCPGCTTRTSSRAARGGAGRRPNFEDEINRMRGAD